MKTNLNKQYRHWTTYQETFDCIDKCLKKTKDWNKRQEKFLVYAKQFFLYKPFFEKAVLYFIYLISLCFLAGILKTIQNPSLQLTKQVITLILIVIYFWIIVSLIKRIPRSLIEYDATWKATLAYYLEESKINKKYNSYPEKYKEAKYRLKTAIRFYKKKGEFLRFFINLLWGGIFVGCLSDSQFQRSLMTLSISKIFDANPFGILCILFLPFMYLWCFKMSELPAIWMQQVVDQIELRE